MISIFSKAAKCIEDMFKKNELNIASFFYNYSNSYYEKSIIFFAAFETDSDLKRLFSCLKNYNHNCQYKHYPTNVVKINAFNNSIAQVIVEHNAMPDILIKYIPETSLISFVCNFGDLLGMWLGLSIISRFNDILIPIFKLTWIKLNPINQIHNVIYINNKSKWNR